MAGYQGDYSNEYLFWDNTEAVTVTIKRPGTPATTNIAIARAYREDLDHDTAKLFDIWSPQDAQVWNIPAALMGSDELRETDLITDASSVVWTVKAAVLERVGTSAVSWRAVCHKEQY